MFSFASKETQDSAAIPGMKFTVRRLNDIQRARRDMKLIDVRARLTELSARFEKIEDLESIERRRLDYEIGLVINADLKPAYIRAGFVSMEGFEIDGAVPTAESLIESGRSDVINEVYAACAAASGMTPDELKNSPSPGTSDVLGAGQESSTTASAAGD